MYSTLKMIGFPWRLSLVMWETIYIARNTFSFLFIIALLFLCDNMLCCLRFDCLNFMLTRYVYWGEYPLSFAACLGQEECYRLMLARGADPNSQDTNGNTILHLLVIYEKKVRQITVLYLGKVHKTIFVLKKVNKY